MPKPARQLTVTAERTYRVTVARGGVQTILPQLLAELAPQRVLLVVADSLVQVAEPVRAQLEQLQLPFQTFLVPPGEAGKTMQILALGWEACAQLQLERTDLILTLGGGAVTDLGGFLAATWLRGVKLLHLPTSLLGMVDAAVGGKTGINTPAGKNLVGAFYSPHAVLVDPQFLRTLPAAELTAGMAEIIKCGFIADGQLLEKLVAGADSGCEQVLEELIFRAIAVKAQVVSEDFHEGGKREILNYGHTLAHAIEAAANYTVRHGEAVASGMMFAAQLAYRLGFCTRSWVELHRQVLESYGLPSSWAGFDSETLLAWMRADKKVRGGQLRFVLTGGENGSKVRVQAVAEHLVREVLEGR